MSAALEATAAAVEAAQDTAGMATKQTTEMAAQAVSAQSAARVPKASFSFMFRRS